MAKAVLLSRIICFLGEDVCCEDVEKIPFRVNGLLIYKAFLIDLVELNPVIYSHNIMRLSHQSTIPVCKFEFCHEADRLPLQYWE